jgi:hypothetical protein
MRSCEDELKGTQLTGGIPVADVQEDYKPDPDFDPVESRWAEAGNG